MNNLIELTLLHTSLGSLAGIEAVGHSLQRLTVQSAASSDAAHTMRTIEPCFLQLTELKFLNLGENQISQIENLQNCLNLQKLFLYNNKIRKIENLQDNVNLEELHLQGNKIKKIENIGNTLVHLKTLMLSANKIEYFDDLNEMQLLPSLSRVSFNCDNFGECPVSQHDNYREYVLNLLTQQ